MQHQTLVAQLLIALRTKHSRNLLTANFAVVRDASRVIWLKILDILSLLLNKEVARQFLKTSGGNRKRLTTLRARHLVARLICGLILRSLSIVFQALQAERVNAWKSFGFFERSQTNGTFSRILLGALLAFDALIFHC